MIDSNTDINDKQLHKIIQSANLYDILSAKHGIHCLHTYLRGTRQIDFMFGTQRLITATQKCGILAFNTYIVSNNRALWIDINIHDILRQQQPSL